MPARVIRADGRFTRKWRVRWRDGTRGASGRYVERASQWFESKLEALAFAKERDRDMRIRRELKYASPVRLLSIDAILERYVTSREAAGELRPLYARELRTSIGQILKMMRWRTVVAVTPEAIDRWIASKARRPGLPSRGVRKPLAQLLAVLRYAARVMRQPVDPGVLAMRPPSQRKKSQPQLLTPEQVAKVLNMAEAAGGPECRWILEHLSTYGCRPIDLCRVTVGDFDADAGTLRLRGTKNGDDLVQPLLPAHVERYRGLVEGRPAEQCLFRSNAGEPWRSGKSASELTDWYWTLAGWTGLRGPQRGIYCLKDFAITTMEAMGISDKTKTRFTGIKTLAVYQHYKATNQSAVDDALGKLGRVAPHYAPTAP